MRPFEQALEAVKDLEGKLYNMEQQDLKQKNEEGRPIRIFMDGAFDMMHYGMLKENCHYFCTDEPSVMQPVLPLLSVLISCIDSGFSSLCIYILHRSYECVPSGPSAGHAPGSWREQW